MTITERIFNRLGFLSNKQFNLKLSEAVKAEIDRNLPRWLGETADARQWDMPSPGIFATQADMYRLSPILGTAVDFLGKDIGTSKMNVKRIVGEDTRDIPNHEFEILLRNPNPADSGIEFLQYTASNYQLNGNAVWWLNRETQNDTPLEMWPVPFSMVTPVPDGRSYIDHYDYFPGNGKPKMRLETYEIVHFKTYNPNNRFIGLSPLESLAVTLQGDLAMRKTNTVNYAEHGGAPQSILSFKEFVPEPAWGDIKAEKRQAAKRNEMMMLRGVGDGVSWLQRALSNKDMDFIAGLKQNLTDVFNRMCPGLISVLSENATEANALAGRATYSEYTKWPLMEVIAQKCTSDIMPAYGRKLICIFDDPRVVDKKLKLEEQAAYERSHTVEEVRKEYYQDDPLGDERDKEFISEVKSAPSPATNPVQNQPSNPPPGNPQNTPPVPDFQSTGQPVNVKAAFDELDRWHKKVKRAGVGVEFTPYVLGTETVKRIKESLKVCRTESAIKALFESEYERIKPMDNTENILEGIRLGIKALEIKG